MFKYKLSKDDTNGHTKVDWEKPLICQPSTKN